MKKIELKCSPNPTLIQSYPLLKSILKDIKRLLMLAGMFVAGILLPLLMTSCTQLTVPSEVQTAFATKFPNMSPTWEKKPYGYEAVFMQNGIEYEAEFSFAGEWLETEYEVVAVAFPQRVLDRVQRDYPGSSITKYEIEITPRGTFYELEIELRDIELEIYYDSQANPTQNTNEDA